MTTSSSTQAVHNPRRQYIPELLTIHLEELEFLWEQRRTALHSPKYFLRDFLHLNERLEAHIQGLLLTPAALPELLLPQLQAAENRDSVFAAACPLLRTFNPQLTEQVLQQFLTADVSVAPGFRDAFSFCSANLYLNALKQILAEAEALPAVYAAGALANLQALDAAHPRLNSLLLHEQIEIAAAAWQASIAADSLAAAPQTPRPYQAGLERPEPGIRDAVIKSAVWNAHVWVEPLLHQLASSGDSVGLKWLAITTGQASHGYLIVKQLELWEKPQSRCEILVRFGHPGVLEILRDWVATGDVILGSAAGEAFSRLTNYDVRGERKEAPVADTADEFEREFAPLIWNTDFAKLDAYLRQNAEFFKCASRWSRGIPLDGVVPAETLSALDLQTRWDQLSRQRFAGNITYKPEPIFT